jgi:hypothetical protein
VLLAAGIALSGALAPLSSTGAGAAASSGWELAYQNESTGDLALLNAAGGAVTDLGSKEAMASGTSPAIAAAGSSAYVVAFQASNGDLDTYATSGMGTPPDSSIAMATGSSPAIASSGVSVEVAFVNASGDLVLYNPGNGTSSNTGLAVAAQTNPAITPTTGGWEVAYQDASTGHLFLYSSATKGVLVDAHISMATSTSPSIAIDPGGTYEVAVQNSNHQLETYRGTSGTKTDTAQGMATGTSPAIAKTPGGFEIAFTTINDSLATYDSLGVSTVTSEMISAGTSPSIAAAKKGGFEPAFQSPSGALDLFGIQTSGALASSTAPSIALSTPLAVETKSFHAYGQVAKSTEECYATSGDPLSVSSSCKSWQSPPTAGSAATAYSAGDFCLAYGTNAQTLSTNNATNLVGKIGFTAPRGNQIEDPFSGSTCATSRIDSRYGLWLHSSKATSFCLGLNSCGMVHTVNFASTALRPWYANGELVMSANYNVVTDNVGTSPYPKSSWHSYLCNWLQDQASGHQLQLCEETWRSDSYMPQLCSNLQVGGTNVCTTPDGDVSSICDADAGGFDECVSPDFTGSGTIAWTRPQANTMFSTNLGTPYFAGNRYGTGAYSVAVTQANMGEIIRLINLALSIDQGKSHFGSVAPFSTAPSDYAATVLEVGNEGIQNYGSTVASIGSSAGSLSETFKY